MSFKNRKDWGPHIHLSNVQVIAFYYIFLYSYLLDKGF